VLDAEAEGEPAPEERSVQRRVLAGGMAKMEMVLEPDEAELMMRAIERAREVAAEEAAGACEETGWPSRADGAVRVAESYLAGHPASGTGGDRFQVMVHLGQEALAADGQWAATLEDGSRVPAGAEALRRVACDCSLVAVGEGQDGENLNIGRRSRSIPPALRRALMVRDRGCAFPGCTHSRFLHAHHIKHWLHGGETSLANTAALCSTHHHLVHEGGWSISRGADGQLLFHSPCGQPIAQNPPRELVEDIDGWMREWADERGLDLGPDVNWPQWDGSKPDYNLAISGSLDDDEPGAAARHAC